ncbi:MAG: adenylate/guanylate cyclase domain-containing protein [Planctomycetaceae bacterium]|nr:adenylate/guanylate cyclase domain-containing protein [Planctomycetales bacterium]MCB9872856.1 adenylate/guanylate cyclase domain-containing protein [Planctomycetaceae bacterium]MCB9941395.1 adenylate/guanylate cyclase domain-containing protein [Planctomycetaceae bacterium]
MAQATSSTLQISISGPDPSQRIQNVLKEGEMLRIGRAPQKGWAIPWDLAISREHADLCWAGGKLRVVMLPAARNPIVYRNRMTKELSITAGDWFQIGATTFQAVGATSQPNDRLDEDTISTGGYEEPGAVIEAHSFSEEDLGKVAFRNTDQQIEILAKLPRAISGSQSDEDLGSLVSRLLLDAIPQAEAVAVAHYDETKLPQSEGAIDAFPEPLTLRFETRDDFTGRFNPSRRMILKSLREQSSILHIWDSNHAAGAFTISEGLGWAFCVPIRGESCQGWCMYVSGKGAEGGGLMVSDDDLAGNLRFTELVAQFIGSIRHVRILQEQKTQLSSFFSPKVIEGLTGVNGKDSLSPSEKEISVLFCDVRGFSKKSEKLQDDLLTLLHSVSAALGVMAGGILERDGAIADFQGDAALGFWGWPVELEEGPVPACRAALSIYTQFYNEIAVEGSLLEGFSVGLGIAHGRALAGQIGTDQQAKVGVFGPVVNQGARLETMTKQFNLPICIDETTAEYAKKHLQPTEGRIRRLARVRPKGMDTPMNVYGLVPPSDQMSEISDQTILVYEAALDAIIASDWKSATKLLATVPDSDGPKQFLLRRMADFGNSPPPDWDGAFSLADK